MLTSNAKIENLYKNGLQRDKFIRDISQLEKSFVVYEFIGDKDYRLKNINLNSSKNREDFSQDQIFDFIKKNFNFIGDLNKELEINDRTFRCKGNTKDFIWFSYKEFFRQNLAISHYLSDSRR